MIKPDHRLEVLSQYTIKQDGKARGLYTIHNSSNPPILEFKFLKYPSKEVPAHPVISSLYVQLYRHETPSDGGTPKVMHEFLGKQDTVSNISSIDKGPLLRTNETRHDQLQPLNQDPSTNLIEGSA